MALAHPRQKPIRPASPEEDPQSPSPPPSPSPSPGGPEASRGSTRASSAASEFVADPGPTFDPEQAPAAPELEAELALEVIEEWKEETVRELLTSQGQLTHFLLRVDAAGDTETWKHTRDDLDRIAPPLTRMLNRYDATRAAAAAGDEISLMAGVSQYAVSNYVRRRRYLAAVAAQPDVPITGRAAEPGTGPSAEAYAPGEQPIAPPVEMTPPPLTPKGPA